MPVPGRSSGSHFRYAAGVALWWTLTVALFAAPPIAIVVAIVMNARMASD